MMKYRMYKISKQWIAVIASLLLVGCSTMGKSGATGDTYADAIVENDREPASVNDTSGREPAAMVGNQEWLNEVQDDFSRIADETSSRTVASRKPDVLVERARWVFQYMPANNQFLLKLDGSNYGMIQTSLDDQNLFSFAAEGQTETPITLTVARNDGRQVAEAATIANASCSVELSYWDAKNKKYQKDAADFRGQHCDKVINQLRSYVP